MESNKQSVITYLTEKKVFQENVQATKIPIGASGSEVFFATDDKGEYVFKISSINDKDKLSMFTREYDFYQISKKLNLSYVPKVIYLENNSEYGYIIVMERLNTLTHAEWNIEMQKKAIDLCAKFHSLDINTFDELNLQKDTIQINEEATEYAYHSWQEVIEKHNGKFSQVMLKEIYKNLAIVCPILNSEPFHICHGDFHPDNLLHDGKNLYLTDWQNIHIGKSAGDISFFVDRGSNFGISMNRDDLFKYYAERISEYTRKIISYDQILKEDSASTLLTTFSFWAEYLKDAPYERVAYIFNQMVSAYNKINHL